MSVRFEIRARQMRLRSKVVAKFRTFWSPISLGSGGNVWVKPYTRLPISNANLHPSHRFHVINKQLSYRRETALQDGLVMAKSGRLELRDNIYGQYRSIYSTTATYLARKEIEIGEKTQNKGWYAKSFKVIQGHRGRYQSKARMRLPISD